MIHVAIIGAGNISSAHIRAYQAFPDRCKVVAIVDIQPGKAAASAASHGLDAEALESYEALLGRDDIGLVSICTPPFTHAELAEAMLRDGKHVLVEKPMAASLAECDRMIRAAQESGKVLSVVAQNRFRDPIMQLKQLLDDGKIGRVVHAQVDSYWWRGHCYYDLWWRGLWAKEGGGPTLNHAVHHIDMLGWMMGLPAKVSAMLSNAAHDNAEVEDISVAALQYPGGAMAQVTSSVIHHGEEQQIVFQGERARISAPWKVYASRSLDNGFPERNSDLEAELELDRAGLQTLEHTGHKGQIDDVLTAIETGREPLVTGESGRMTLELITAIYKAGFEERTVELPIAADDPCYTAEGIVARAPRFYAKTAAVQELGAGLDITTGSDYRS
ncbi:Gfo/Idh/MocA family protein [Paenibacillus sp. 598K]|uniref:Gfo/Idh/MocA family protein n=1 Tax=Paenibacillus sp. 598K TaxID=1117987 RepID=UPI000FFF161C|nr:Gfo/Idh/MocA family oxidoreductase [Paenibacillus sp. 598K]